MKRGDLSFLGWNESFERSVPGGEIEGVARVLAVDRELLWLADAKGPFRARLAGAFFGHAESSDAFPCVGDWVVAERLGEGEPGRVRSLIERRTFLRRRAAGSAKTRQMIAANVDQVFVVQSCHFDFNVRRLERYLVMVHEGGAEPVVLLTKRDLVGDEILSGQLEALRGAGIAAPVRVLSSVTREGVDDLRTLLQAGKTYCLVGSSGVGKSTLINLLLGNGVQATSAVSGTGEGRHTTVRRELLVLEGGALVIDNPGMRELGLAGSRDVEGGFVSIKSLAGDCRYRDCSHTAEPGCAVLQALAEGTLSEESYESFVKLRKEARFGELSYLEKRQRDRAFGRLVRSVKRDMRED